MPFAADFSGETVFFIYRKRMDLKNLHRVLQIHINYSKFLLPFLRKKEYYSIVAVDELSKDQRILGGCILIQ